MTTGTISSITPVVNTLTGRVSYERSDITFSTSAVSVFGFAEVGQVLTVIGTWGGYQWYADGVAIEGATGSTFTVTSAQDGASISVVVQDEGASIISAGTVPVVDNSFDFAAWLSGEDGAYYEVSTQTAFTDAAGTTAAGEGDTVELLKVAAGDAAYNLVFSGDKPTLVRRGDYWGLSIPTTGAMASATAAFTVDSAGSYLLACVERVTDNSGTVLAAMATTSTYFRLLAQGTMRVLGQIRSAVDTGGTTGVTDDYPLYEARVIDSFTQALQVDHSANQSALRTDATLFNGETIPNCHVVLNGTAHNGVISPSGNEIIFFGGLIANKAPGADRAAMQAAMASLGGALVEANALVGNADADSVRFLTQIGDAGQVRMHISESESLADPILTPYTEADTLKRLDVSGLAADTQYHFRLEREGRLSGVTGKFRTMPASFDTLRLVVGSCSGADANNGIYNLMVGLDPDLVLHMGDFHYNNPINEAQHIEGFAVNAFGFSRQRLFMRSSPFLWMWDDHDFAGNNSFGGSSGRDAAVGFYREYAPSPELAAAGALDAVYWTKTVDVGGLPVRIISTDQRSERSVNSATDDASKVMLGATQEAWFEAQLVAARDAGEAVIWMQGQAFQGSSLDGWPVYTTERDRLWQMFFDEDVHGRMLALGGDSHVTYLDDGTNHEFVAGAPVPVIISSPFHQTAKVPSGTYSHGSFANDNQFVLVDLTSDGRNILTVEATAYGIIAPDLDELGTMTVERDVSLFPANLLTGVTGAVFDAAEAGSQFADAGGATAATLGSIARRTNDMGRHYLDVVAQADSSSPTWEQSGAFYRRSYDGVDDRSESSDTFTLALPFYIGMTIEKGGQLAPMFYLGSGTTFRVRIQGQSNGGVMFALRLDASASEKQLASPSDVMPLNTATRIEALALADGTMKLWVNGVEYSSTHPFTASPTVALSVVGFGTGGKGYTAPGSNAAFKTYRAIFMQAEPDAATLTRIRTWLDAGAGL